MKNHIFSTIFCIVFTSLSFGQVQPNEVHQIAEPNASITAANFNVDVSKMANNPFYNNQLKNIDWTYCTAKYEADIKVESQDLSGTFSFRMKKDSIIWFSVSAIMGIQILKGIINRDSAHILDLYNQKYYGLSLQDLSRMQELPANISAIQALIMGNSPTTDLILKDSTLLNNEYTHNWLGNNALFLNYSASSKNKIFTESRFSDKGKMRKLVIGYTDRQLIENIAIPRKMNWSIIEQKSDLNNLRLDLTLKTARFDAIPSYPFSIPADYERVPIQKN
jgi:hypothetical protein